MKELLEIIKITLPSLIVFGVVYYLLNQFLKNVKEKILKEKGILNKAKWVIDVDPMDF